MTCADPGIFVRGGGPGPSVIKIPDNVFLVFSLVLLHLFYRLPMVYFKENYNFPRFQKTPKFFPGGGGPTFSRGGGGPIAYSLLNSI